MPEPGVGGRKRGETKLGWIIDNKADNKSNCGVILLRLGDL